MSSASTTGQFSTELTADTVAFCPYEGAHNLLACGCYQLVKEEEPPRRIGRLSLLDATTGKPLQELQRIDGPGVLDCAWMPGDGHGGRLLATASSEGGARFYRLGSSEDGTSELCEEGAGFVLCEGAGWCMVLDWASTAAVPQVALGSTAGMIHICVAAPDGLRCERAWDAHDLECWAVGWDATSELGLFSGADDGMLKRWDLRCDPADGAAATASNRKSHSAGVCCVSNSLLRPEVLVTGRCVSGIARMRPTPPPPTP